MKHLNITSLLLASITLICGLLPGTTGASQADDVLGAVFSEMAKQVIRDYYKERYEKSRDEDDDNGKGKKHKKSKGKKQKGLPPGLAKREKLPPGLARQLKEKGRLPPGLEKRDLPASLESMLPETTHPGRSAWWWTTTFC
ncbi:hypothetical protein [Solemya velesiana gill symbiont]|uniref:Uncharacterized protein n=1 Tax=Solemya velesiana gill symbiont TaxID=1918948 RepID=A0A1T2KYD8_9GAMM|nr:hypothetical protein [Solemya velesiana gill symbiont]OOZ37878.1 hypothetical protein BOW51_00265 [Solemya velesiana gill symbiont]